MSAAVEVHVSELEVLKMRPELLMVLHVLHVKRIAGVAQISAEVGFSRTWARPFVLALELSGYVLELYPPKMGKAVRDKREALFVLTERGVEASQLTDEFVRSAIAKWTAVEREKKEKKKR